MSFLLQALLPVGAVLGSPLGGIIADRIGRKAALQVGAVPSLIGWVLLFVAQYTTSTSTFKSFLLLGRGLAGVATGMQSTVIPVSTCSIMQNLFKNNCNVIAHMECGLCIPLV